MSGRDSKKAETEKLRKQYSEVLRDIVEHKIKPSLKPDDLYNLLRYELVEESVSSLTSRYYSRYYESPYLKKVRELGFKGPKGQTPKRPKRKRNEVKTIVAALLKQKFTMKEVAQKLGFKLTKDSYENLSYSKTGRRYVQQGTRILRGLKRKPLRLDFRLDEEGLPELYIGDIGGDIPFYQTNLCAAYFDKDFDLSEFVKNLIQFRQDVRNLYKQALEKERG